MAGRDSVNLPSAFFCASSCFQYHGHPRHVQDVAASLHQTLPQQQQQAPQQQPGGGAPQPQAPQHHDSQQHHDPQHQAPVHDATVVHQAPDTMRNHADIYSGHYEDNHWVDEHPRGSGPEEALDPLDHYWAHDGVRQQGERGGGRTTTGWMSIVGLAGRGCAGPAGPLLGA